MKLVIVGGVAGGATAAARARRLSEKADITLFERGQYVSFSNCGLPYYIGGKIESRNDLFIASPERLEARYRLKVRRSQEVTAIDRTAKEVEVRDLASGRIYREPYDRLILSPGARPLTPPLPGVDLDTVFTLRDVPDADSIKGNLGRKNARSAVVVGGGFIGLEMVENLARLGVRVTVIEMLDQVLPQLDFEMAAIVEEQLRQKGVELLLGDAVQSFRKKGERTVVSTASGSEIEADTVILSIGVRPEKALAEAAGLALGTRGGILVDETLRTSDPDIFAIGDAIEVKDYVSGESVLIPLAGPANRQGRIAADNALGRNETFKGVVGTSVVKVFDMVAASTGDNEKFLKRIAVPTSGPSPIPITMPPTTRGRREWRSNSFSAREREGFWVPK
ncbi:MAG: FAD-dependent oxidoreductase [Deltaproteobacteria bacterium]